MTGRDLADVIIVGLPKLEGGVLGPLTREGLVQARRLNRAQGFTGQPCTISYTHGSTGHDDDGAVCGFGGPMVFSAWCACGRFRYDGDESSRRAAVTAHLRWTKLTIDDVVTFHGPHHQGREFVITAVHEDDSLSLEDVDWGDIQLSRANRAYVESAGRSWLPHTCDCPHYMRRVCDGSCAHYYCPSPH